MRLQIEPNVTTLPLVEGQISENGAGSPGTYDIDALLKTGISAAQNGEREFARLSLAKATEIDPQCEDAWMWLASISEYPEELLALLDRVLDINAENARALEWRASTKAMMARTFVQRAVEALEDGSTAVMSEFLEQALEHDTDCESAWELKAQLAAEPDQKFACFERILEINPENADASRAIEDIKQRRVEAKFSDAKAAADAGERDRALELVDEFLENAPDNVEAWTFRANLSEDESEKLACFARILEIDPENENASRAVEEIKRRRVEAKFSDAKAAANAGDCDRALELVDEFIENVPDNAEAWIFRSSLFEDENAKLACFERALEINPEEIDAISAIHEIKRRRLDASFAEAKAAAVAGKRKKALELVDEFLRSVPENAEAWILRSHLALDLDDKMQSLESALAIEPDNAAARAGFEFLKSTFSPAAAAETVQEAEEVQEIHAEAAQEIHEEAALEVHEEAAQEVQAEAAVDQDDQLVIEAVEVVADDIPVVYDDRMPVENLPIQAPPDDDFFAPAGTRSGAETTVDEEPILAPTDEEIFQALEAIDPYATVTEPAEQIGNALDNIDPYATITGASPPVESVESSPEPFEADHHQSENGANADPLQLDATPASGVPCPYCKAASLPQSFECVSCNAVLSLSDIESLISNGRARRDVIQEAVTQMEAEWHLREFDEAELTSLAIGHFNLRNFAAGFTYLQEASRLSPNNVILAGQVTAIQIRMDEMRRQEEQNQGKPKGKTILVVDDSPTVRKLISGKLEKSGHNVVCACDGVEALERIEENLPDLVLLDIAMPRMDGYEVCRQIRANAAAQDLPVVMISGKDGFFDKVRGRMAGTSGYVTKPFGPETLMKALETYLRPDAI